MTRPEIEAELARQEAIIDAAYWAFTRRARAKPPSVAVPQAYAERNRLRQMLRAIAGPA